MVLTYDVGSIPFYGDYEKFKKGLTTNRILGLLNYNDHTLNRRFFEDRIVETFIDKIKAGISVPNYPQFRDMDEMFLNCVDGIIKTRDGYKIIDKVSVVEKKLLIPEITVIKDSARYIFEKVGEPFKVKICITGPYTLASLFVDRESQLFLKLGDIVSKFIDANIFTGNFGRVELLAVDEPIFGLIDDPLLDYGTGGREELLKAWENVFHTIKSKRVQSIIHLHNTANTLFWKVQSLDIVESHVNDSLYSSPKTRQYLEKYDKLLKASVCITEFDSLIKSSIRINNDVKISQQIASMWKLIKKGEMDPTIFLESSDLILDRLQNMIRQYGERVAYAGPECGLISFPTYHSAIECLRRVAEASKQLNPNN